MARCDDAVEIMNVQEAPCSTPSTPSRGVRLSDFIATFLREETIPFARSIAKVQALLAQDYDASELATHIRADPSLAARVIATGNSAFFAHCPCDTVEMAVNRLGSANLRRVLGRVLVDGACAHPLNGYGLPLDAIWRRSITTAVACELIALRTGADYASAYTAGLLHCLGMIPIEHANRRKRPVVRLVACGFGTEWSASERAHFGFDQAAAGAEMLRQMGFPESITGPIAAQLDIPTDDISRCLYAARAVRHKLVDGGDPEAAYAAMRACGIGSNEQLEAFAVDVAAEVRRLETL